MNTSHIVCVSCTKSKRDEPAQAKNLYDESHYFRLQREYAKLTGTSWVILSAKHGVVYPDAKLEPYEMYLADQTTEYQQGWGESVARSLRFHNPRKVTMLAGKAYVDDVIPALEADGMEVLEPLRGLRHGERLSRLQDLIQSAKHKSLC